MAKEKRPRDLNQRAKNIVGLATGEITELKPEKNPAAVELGRLGGLKGGPARASKLSPERRKEIAQNAVNARWDKIKRAVAEIQNRDKP
jgi:hypothetical protein